MSLPINLRHLERKNVQAEGKLSAEELDLNNLDELVQVASPLEYDLEVQKLEKSLLAQGQIKLELQCECVRCLRKFQQVLRFENWACHIPLEGEDRARQVDDCVDLTPYIREDMVLAFPQHPLCETDCAGLQGRPNERAEQRGAASDTAETSSAWTELNKLKF